MSAAEKMVPETEAVKRERRASANARCAALWKATQRSPHRGYVDGPCAECFSYVAHRFPLPTVTVTRPRVVQDPFNIYRDWRVINGEFETRRRANGCGDFKDWHSPNEFNAGSIPATAARVRMWADLLANPTETVEVEP
jgi:hypothetical protein